MVIKRIRQAFTPNNNERDTAVKTELFNITGTHWQKIESFSPQFTCTTSKLKGNLNTSLRHSGDVKRALNDCKIPFDEVTNPDNRKLTNITVESNDVLAYIRRKKIQASQNRNHYPARTTFEDTVISNPQNPEPNAHAGQEKIERLLKRFLKKYDTNNYLTWNRIEGDPGAIAFSIDETDQTFTLMANIRQALKNRGIETKPDRDDGKLSFQVPCTRANLESLKALTEASRGGESTPPRR